jgi:hypothetical protein
MKEIYNDKHNDNEIDFQELFHVLFKKKWTIVSLTTFVSIIGIIYSLLLPNIYQSKALLVTVNSSSNFSNSGSSSNGLAALAGINLPSGAEKSNSDKALQKLNTLSFFKDSIMPNIFLPDLMAFKSWDYQTNSLLYDESIYDKNKNTWSRLPTAQQSFGVFLSQHLSIDSENGFITIAIKHQSPLVAKQWTEVIIDEINAFYRKKDKSESEKAIIFLNKQIAMTGLSEIKQVIAELLQEETQKLTLIEASQSYVFDYIDPPAVMEYRSEPNRTLIAIISVFLGIIFSILLILIKHFNQRKNSS